MYGYDHYTLHPYRQSQTDVARAEALGQWEKNRTQERTSVMVNAEVSAICSQAVDERRDVILNTDFSPRRVFEEHIAARPSVMPRASSY